MKYVIDLGFIGVMLWLTFRLLFKGQELGQIIDDLTEARPEWIAAGILAVFFFFFFLSSIIFYILRLFKYKRISMRKCLKYSFIGFFFSYITPSASGGQPAQMYYMSKDGVKLGLSSLIMVLITIAYKGVLVIMGLLLMAINSSTVFRYAGKLGWLLLLGFVLNILFIGALLYLLKRPDKVRIAGIKIVDILTGKGIIREGKSGKYSQKIMKICDNYTLGAVYVRENPSVMVKILLMTAIQRLCLFSVTWIVYKAYDLSGVSYFNILTLQVMIGVAVEMLPLPGAAGITEGCFILSFGRIFGKELVKPALLISRGLSFYLLLIVGGIVTLAAHIIVMRKDKKELEKIEKNSNQ